ncbi:MAG: CinA family protein [Lagierella massiliensis]|nr:CinA family protein [Lagierella massiliensis]
MKYSTFSEMKCVNKNINVDENFILFLIKNKITVSTAESLTAGLISSTIANVPGASSVLEMGLVTYTEESKNLLLNVSRETLQRYSAVSFATCYEMLNGLELKSNSMLNIATTGYAGPGDKAGLVFIGVSFMKNKHFYRLKINGDRNEIRLKVVSLAFYFSNNLIKEFIS